MVGKDVEKLEPLHAAGGSVKQCGHKGQVLQDSSTLTGRTEIQGETKRSGWLPRAGWEWVVIV